METREEWIVYQYERGLLLEHIAKIYNLKRSKVEKVLKEAGITELRPQTPKIDHKLIKRMKEIENVKTIATSRAAIATAKRRFVRGG